MEKRILIVDDDPASLRLLNHFLTNNGYEVFQATNGREAMQVVLEVAPPLVVTDWSMPEMDGLALCRALREHEGVRFVYVLMITGHSDTDRLVEAFNAGADDFLAKPVNQQELIARLRAGGRIARLEEDLARRTRDVHRLNAQAALANQKLEEANARLRSMAMTDELTGLLNRRMAMTRLRELWLSQERYDVQFSCVMLDIDHFKRINDTYGHAVGDMVLVRTAAVLQQAVRGTDIVCRIGGEEFLILCPHVDLDGGAVCAEHLREAVENSAFLHGGEKLHMTVSLGVAQRNDSMKTPDELIRSADEALYRSKAAGRNRVTISSLTQPATA